MKTCIFFFALILFLNIKIFAQPVFDATRIVDTVQFVLGKELPAIEWGTVNEGSSLKYIFRTVNTEIEPTYIVKITTGDGNCEPRFSEKAFNPNDIMEFTILLKTDDLYGDEKRHIRVTFLNKKKNRFYADFYIQGFVKPIENE